MLTRVSASLTRVPRVSIAARSYAVSAKPIKKTKIEILLTQDVTGVGMKGELLTVARGFARNHLFAKGYAIHSTQRAKQEYEDFTSTVDKTAAELIRSAGKMRKRIGKLTVAMKRHQVVPGRMIVPVTAENICEKMMKQHKLSFKPEQLLLKDPITSFGHHTVPLDLGQGQTAEFLLTVDPR